MDSSKVILFGEIPEWCAVPSSITRDDVVRVGACRDGVNCFADRWYPNLTELLFGWKTIERSEWIAIAFRVQGEGFGTYGISRNGFAGKGTGLGILEDVGEGDYGERYGHGRWVGCRLYGDGFIGFGDGYGEYGETVGFCGFGDNSTELGI